MKLSRLGLGRMEGDQPGVIGNRIEILLVFSRRNGVVLVSKTYIHCEIRADLPSVIRVPAKQVPVAPINGESLRALGEVIRCKIQQVIAEVVVFIIAPGALGERLR